jgi:hypothetical protein
VKIELEFLRGLGVACAKLDEFGWCDGIGGLESWVKDEGVVSANSNKPR